MEEKKLNFKIVKSSSDGRILVSINGIRYRYTIGGHQVNHALNLSKRIPGKALDFIKKAAGKNFEKTESLCEKILSLWN